VALVLVSVAVSEFILFNILSEEGAEALLTSGGASWDGVSTEFSR